MNALKRLCMRSIGMPILWLLILSACQTSSAQQSSTFTISGWTPGSTPIFSGPNSNVIDLAYGDSLHSGITFTGIPNDGIGTDQDNIAVMNFSYTYTIYLTPKGSVFSAGSIPVGSHTVSANQACSSDIIPPWTIGCDDQAVISSDSIGMSVADHIGDCVPAGDYQVDIVINNYSVITAGPNPQTLQLQWTAYTNAPSIGMSTLFSPQSGNVPSTALSPANNYLLGQVAYAHINASASCPTPILVLPATINTSAAVSSATVVASYAGSCAQNPCSYRWSDGENTATANHLTSGTYTVTVTTPCGATATASITISHRLTIATMGYIAAVNQGSPIQQIIKAHHDGPQGTTSDKTGHMEKSIDHNDPEKEDAVQVSLSTYPNPVMHNITFDMNDESAAIQEIRIYDLSGAQVMSATDQPAGQSAGSKVTINVDRLARGIYVYEVSGDQAYRGKFVKQ